MTLHINILNQQSTQVGCDSFYVPLQWSQSFTNNLIFIFYSLTTCFFSFRSNDDTLRNLTLIEIEQLLHINQRSLKDYPTMPYPQDINLTSYLQNNLVLSKLDYNHDETRSEFEHLFASMTGNIPIHIL